MRIVTRPDFDGIVCAVLLMDALDITEPIKWVEPNAMQHGLIEIKKGDVIANLAYSQLCSLWFDHHESNRISGPFSGVFKIAPSAAGIIYEYYMNTQASQHLFQRDYSRLVKETDKIDSAKLTLEEVLNPGKNPYVALSSTIASRASEDEPYWNKVVDLLRKFPIEEVLKDPEVNRRVQLSIAADKEYKDFLEKYTRLHAHVSVTDYRSLNETPSGNRFLVFSLFPESVVNLKVRFENKRREAVVISLGHSIFNRGCHVSAGEICAHFGGGGHRGAGSCCVPADKADQAIATILDILLKNQASSFPILYEDDYLIAVDKPPGLLSDSKRVVNYQGPLYTVFPLQKKISGIVLFAKNNKVQKVLQANAGQGKVMRQYYALVKGVPINQSGTINRLNPGYQDFIEPGDNTPGDKKDIPHTDNQSMRVHYEQLRSCDSYSLLKTKPVPDDTVQTLGLLNRMGCPVVGDPNLETIDESINRLGLHAYFIAFSHPVTNKRVVLETPLPQVFNKICSGFESKNL
jgi:23S rRNA-/tRNA-specific pseudouridylate synthase